MIDILRKKLLYRSAHRGCKEMDLLLSSFVKENLENLSIDETIELESLLSENELEIKKWIVERIDIPLKYEVIINKINIFNQEHILDR